MPEHHDDHDGRSEPLMRIKRPFWQSEEKPISCRQLGPVLQAYLDGEIQESDMEAIRDHLDACRDCGLEAETYEQLKSALSRQRPAVSSDTLERLRQFSATLGEQVASEDQG